MLIFYSLLALLACWVLWRMVDITITATNVTKGTGATLNQTYYAGESITAGQCVYKKASDGKLWKAQCDGTAAEAAAIGIALHAASADQPLAIQTGGTINIGATVVVGTIYVVSGTAGGIAPWADLATTNYVTILGYGATASTITMDINATGIVHA